MHGSICVILKKFVEQSHGKETWKEILRLAGHDGLVLSPIQSYPDEAVFAIVGATCEHLEVDMQTGLEAVGKFAAPELVRFATEDAAPRLEDIRVACQHRNIDSPNYPSQQP